MNDTTILIIIIGLVVLMISISSTIKQLKNDIARMNTTLDKIAKQIGVTNTFTENIDVELKNELKSLILDGKSIKAIKKYRMVTGLGLKEAKEYVDYLIEHELK